jgi:hypothetical protein
LNTFDSVVLASGLQKERFAFAISGFLLKMDDNKNFKNDVKGIIGKFFQVNTLTFYCEMNISRGLFG